MQRKKFIAVVVAMTAAGACAATIWQRDIQAYLRNEVWTCYCDRCFYTKRNIRDDSSIRSIKPFNAVASGDYSDFIIKTCQY